MALEDYGFKKYLVKAISDLGFKDYSPIQKMVFESLKSSNNIIAKSKTGSGKTHAYLLPILNELDPNNKKTQAIIVTPTVELARQVYKVCAQLCSYSKDQIVVKAYYGGSDLQKDIAKIGSNNPQVVIATLGRLQDLVVKQNVLKIHEASYFVIDEADMVVDSFLDELLALSNSITKCKKLVFSATYNDNLLVLLRKYLTNTIFIEPKEETVSSLDIKHYLIPLRYQEKEYVLDQLLKIVNPYLAIIFVNNKEDIAPIYAKLKDQGYSVCMFHGNLDIRSRKRIVNEINALRYQYVISTDILARGIDIIGVSHIINYDLPKDFEFYIHRSGRAGRMDFSGICYSLYSVENQEYLNNLAKKGITFEYLTIKNGELVPYIKKDKNKISMEEEKIASRLVKKSNVVKPGYKKKYQEEKKKIIKKIRKNKYR